MSGPVQFHLVPNASELPFDEPPEEPRKEKLLTSQEVGALFGVGATTVARWAREGLIKPEMTTRGGHRRYSQKSIDGLREKLAFAAADRALVDADAADGDIRLHEEDSDIGEVALECNKSTAATPAAPQDGLLLTPREAAEMLGVCTTTIARWAREELITPAGATIGGHRRYHRSEVDRILSEISEREHDIDVGKAVELYQGGMTVREVAAEFDLGYGVMRRLLAKHTTLRERGGGSRPPRNLTAYYLEQGYSPRQARRLAGWECESGTLFDMSESSSDEE